MNMSDKFTFRNYTYNTKNCTTHQPYMSPELHGYISSLMFKRKGKLGVLDGVTYDFMEYGVGAGLIIESGKYPAHVSYFCHTQQDAILGMKCLSETAREFVEKTFISGENMLENAVAPCLLTFLFPTIIFIPRKTIRTLASVPCAFAEVWLTMRTAKTNNKGGEPPILPMKDYVMDTNTHGKFYTSGDIMRMLNEYRKFH